MKAKLLVFFITIFTVGAFAFGQDVVSDVGTVAKDTGRVTEKAVQKTAHGAAKATKVTVHGSEKVASETAAALKRQPRVLQEALQKWSRKPVTE
jgi:hypothetical protein